MRILAQSAGFLLTLALLALLLYVLAGNPG